MLLIVALLLGIKAVAIVTAVAEPPLPPLLRGLPGVGGDTTVCPPATEQEAASARRATVQSPTAWSPELGRRLEREFPPGSDAKLMTDRLQKLGFTLTGSCRTEPSIRSALFQQHGGFALRPAGVPMSATVWWHVDASDHLIWTRGMVAYDGL